MTQLTCFFAGLRMSKYESKCDCMSNMFHRARIGYRIGYHLSTLALRLHLQDGPMMMDEFGHSRRIPNQPFEHISLPWCDDKMTYVKCASQFWRWKVMPYYHRILLPTNYFRSSMCLRGPLLWRRWKPHSSRWPSWLWVRALVHGSLALLLLHTLHTPLFLFCRSYE